MKSLNMEYVNSLKTYLLLHVIKKKHVHEKKPTKIKTIRVRALTHIVENIVLFFHLNDMVHCTGFTFKIVTRKYNK